MKVKQLQRHLEDLDPEAEVIVQCDQVTGTLKSVTQYRIHGRNTALGAEVFLSGDED